METSQTYWDPLSEQITSDSFHEHTKKILTKVKDYEKDPEGVKLVFFIFVAIPVISVILFILAFGVNSAIVWAVIIPSIPLAVYYSTIQTLQQGMILYLLAKENGWIYNPDNQKTKERTNKLKELFPTVFNEGNPNSQHIKNQIWGFLNDGERKDFWLSDFEYVTGSGKHSETHHHTVAIIKLRKNVPVTFDLESKLFMALGKTYKTESEEFNKLYRIKMKDGNGTESDLFKVLTPSLQVRFIDLANTVPIWRIAIHNNMMTLDINMQLFKPKHTNFVKKVAVDERDKQIFLSYIHSIIAISTDMLQFMD